MEHTTVAAASRPHAVPIVDHEAVRLMESEEVTISFYENEVPPFVEAELQRLYESIYTSLARFRIYGEIDNASTYVARKDGTVVAVFLFRRERGELKVLNKQARIDEAEVCRFANAAFSAFKSVTVISFWAIEMAAPEFRFPYQRSYCLSDIVVSLPDTAEVYLASLGKQMRRQIRSNMKKIRQSFPSFLYEIHEKEKVSEQHILDIIRLNSARMAVKDKVSYNSDEETERLIRLAKVCGFVAVATIDGRVCAGTICYCVGTTYFAHALSHDPQYDGYKLGTLCCYLTICESIARGGKEWRFGGSTHRYKFDFQGAWRGFDHLSVYRSRAHFLLNGGRVVKTALNTYALQAKLWLLLAERRDSFLSRVATSLVYRLRNLRRFREELLATRK